MDSALQRYISLSGALAAITQVGDLGMGQPLGHSRRVAGGAQAAHGDDRRTLLDLTLGKEKINA